MAGYTDLVDRWADTDRRAITVDDRVLTYAQWRRDGRRVASALLTLGLRRPARVAVILPNGPDFAIMLYACARIGVTLVPVSTWAVGAELRRILHAAGADLLVASDFTGDRDETRDALTVEGLLAMGGDEGALAAAEAGGTDEAVLAILFTSGSTGAPKGVILGQDAVRRNGSAIAERMGLTGADRVYSYFPMFFSGGLCNVLSGAASVGAELVTQARYDPARAARLIRERECTVHNVWHDGLDAVASHLDRDDLGRMRRGLVLDVGLFERMGLPYDEGVNMYGMTETATAFTCHDFREPESVRRSGHGAPLVGNEARVVDPDTGGRLPQGSEGELIVSGPNLMRGYTDGSHASFIDEDGFFHTGDTGWIDDIGHVHYTGRLKTLIKVKGLTVQPEEVEAVLTAHPRVQRAVVVGVGESDESLGLVALVVCDDDSVVDALQEQCRRELSSYKVPRVVRVADADFPLSASSKIDRRAARSLAAAS